MAAMRRSPLPRNHRRFPDCSSSLGSPVRSDESRVASVLHVMERRIASTARAIDVARLTSDGVLDILLESDRVVDARIFGCIDQGDIGARQQRENGLDADAATVVELTEV